jgi:hypothetical protein
MAEFRSNAAPINPARSADPEAGSTVLVDQIIGTVSPACLKGYDMLMR